eukprot:m.351206 g.351206  ORF g.351206 m.351206 type:complete len:69 (-) comp51524_c0_seq1:15-221(-)
MVEVLQKMWLALCPLLLLLLQQVAHTVTHELGDEYYHYYEGDDYFPHGDETTHCVCAAKYVLMETENK